MIEYIVLSAMSIDQLRTEVNDHVNKGYTLQGGATPVCSPTGKWGFYQTVIKKVRKSKPTKEVPSEVESVINYFVMRTGKKCSLSESNTKHVSARLADGYSVQDLKMVINSQTAKWLGDDTMDQYLRPQTIFGKEKFEGYLNSATPLKQKFER